MCVGAIVFLMLGRMLGMRPAFLIASGTVLVIALAFAMRLRQPPVAAAASEEASFAALLAAAGAAVRGALPGMRAIFVAALFLQLTFQTFTTWYALHGTERFGVAPEDVTIGFIAWAVGGVLGALPAGVIGMRIGRRNALLLGFALMGACLLALDRVGDISQATPLLALASASWALPTVNAFPLFVEPIPRARRGVLAALYLLCMALGGLVGDPLNGGLFDLFDSYRPMFLMMTVYTAIALGAVLLIPRGTGEADTGPADAVDTGART
jgi:predicted MFS family arabinose efflux permease